MMFNKRQKLLVVLVIAILTNAFFGTTATASAQTQCTDVMKFVTDVTIPDGTTVQPNSQFTKTWRIKNDGTCTWSTSYVFRYVEGELMWASPEAIFMPSGVGASNTIDMTVTFTAPQIPGSYKSYWQMKNASGVAFGPKIWVMVNVYSSVQSVSSSNNGSVSAQATQQFIQPNPKDFDFKEKDANTIEVYYQGNWIAATKSPSDKYKFPQISGTLTLLTYTECSSVWNPDKWWWDNVCVQKQRAVQDLGIHPAVTISREGTLEFYSYINTLTFGMVGTVYGNTLKGVGGYQILEVGNTGTITAATVRTVLARASVPVLIVSYIHYSNKVFLVTYPISPAPIPVPIPAKFQIASYASIQGLYSPVIGQSSGNRNGSNWWIKHQFISLSGACSLLMYLRLPAQNDKGYFQLDGFSKESKQECDPGDILEYLFEIVKQGMAAGVKIETLIWFLNEMLPKITEDFKLDPALIKAIMNILGSI